MSKLFQTYSSFYKNWIQYQDIIFIYYSSLQWQNWLINFRKINLTWTLKYVQFEGMSVHNMFSDGMSTQH
jgi:hypothetical protein